MPANNVPGTEEICTISALGQRGDGIAETPSGRIFVPYVLEGEKVRVKIQKNRVEILEILEESPDRAPPECPHFQTCGGCVSQHMKAQAYNDWKRGLIENALRFRGLDTPVGNVVDAHGAGRQRVTLHMQTIRGRVSGGFMEARSHRLMDLDTCPVLTPSLENVADICRALAKAVRPGKKPFDICVCATESGLDCDIGLKKEPDANTLMDLSEIAAKYDLARVTLGGEMILERRAPIMTFGKARATIPPGAFLQPTREGEIVLAGLIQEFTAGSTKIADLFCGVGPFALRLAETAEILAVDNDKSSISALQNAAHNTQGLKPITAIARDLFRNPVSARDLEKFDAIVFDPPRAGAEAQVREIAASKVELVAAISCDPGTFSRDAAILVENGYILEKITPIDQFKYAAHIEMAALFRRI